ncbi:hypothetical protein NQZ68_027243 [Dissostichus eleginoides]|nr:hypothetical protein NQZ68_027243 [Dissostichus eleginoides]
MLATANTDGVLRFASYYQDHMVLQKSPERAVVWGYGSEGAQVSLTLSGQNQQKISQATVTNGTWRVSLDPVEAGGPYNVTAAVQNIRAVLTDVLFGDVWLCGGQSNMVFQLSTWKKESKSDAFPNIRWHQTADTGFVPNPRMQNTFMAVAMDLPDERSPYNPIHPRDKQDVAFRLSLGARAVAYGEQDVAFRGPFPSQILSTPKYLEVTYDQEVSVTPSENIFEICCSESESPWDPKAHWVPAPIMQWGPTTVQLSTSLCSPTEQVAALRYAWRDWPCDFKACPIYSASKILPAPPFISTNLQPKDDGK